MHKNKNNIKVRTQQIRQQIENLLNDKMLYNNFFSSIFVINETETEIVVDFSDSIAKHEVISRWVDTVEKAVKNLEINKILTFNNDDNYTISFKKKQNFTIKNKYCSFKANNVLNKFTFKNFIKSSYNFQIFNIYDSIIANSKLNYSPIFISGPSGIGKTHFINAMGNLLVEKQKKVFYINDYKFISCITSWMQNGQNEKISEFLDWLSQVDVFLFDDIQGLGHKHQTSIVALEILNRFIEEDKIVIITSDKSPSLLGGFEERFITRFNSGLHIKLGKPKKEDFLRIFKHKLNEEKLANHIWTTEAFEFLSKHFRNSIRELEGALKSIAFYIQTNKDKFKNEIYFDKKKMFEIFVEKYEIEKTITPDLIIEVVSKYYGVSILDLKSEKRDKNIVHARDIAIWLIKNILDLTHKSIGVFFNNRRHSTIISTLKKIDNLKQSNNNELEIAINHIYKQLNWSFKHRK
ncbi:chromosomal replication initiator protein DnaA [Mycoplasma flocculare]|uniref:Chromosomal replication initiator protein DnaA n=2 Tax=Mesomycoplasma flocculare TaxID=2128 RepID=A0A0A8E6I7_MESFC|nr:chromosomal replication initiator protein DnaA [Mesomycoplasma flocculare]MXR39213.1 chromosomal replication initiator protein DnaA [Mycoplasma sp. MF12]AJC49583.1 chromosomal replication initiation protein DnaA [Mesomycoplasma flocculare ATCC 27399]ENX51260.1 chromosomal replication initiator protein [Mesomycoplasma flocculare ATCC 27716]MXR05626.1 chromosomal replication initiator protein DnaA [Mesomycoplasma flocculare]MXR11997.1 chromosomal replication initiator protein DnaA [Mesomycopl